MFGKITDCNNCHTQTSHDQLLPIWSTNNLNQEHLASSGLQAFQTQDIRKLLQYKKKAAVLVFSVFFFYHTRNPSVSAHQQWSVGASVRARGSRARTKLSRLSVSRLTKGLASCRLPCFTWETGRPSCLLFGWIRRGNNYSSKIHPGRASLRAWRPWNHSFHCTACRPLLDLTVPPH